MKAQPVKKLPPKKISVLAIQIKDKNEDCFYVTAIPAKTLFSCCYISRADEDPIKGYQRLLNKSRTKQIADYLNQGQLIPGAIILSTQPDAKLEYDSKTHHLHFTVTPKSFLVIDGQHRLYGASEANSVITLPVSILCGLTQELEVQYFNDINGEQRGVPRTLQLEIEKFLVAAESNDQIRIKLFHALNERPDSPLLGRMSATKSVQGKLTHVPFKAAIDPLLDEPIMKRLDFDQKVQLLLNFLKAMESILVESMGDAKKLSNAAFFQALFIAFKGITQVVVERHQNYKEESFKDVLRPLENIDWSVHSGTNRASIQSLSKHILDLVSAGGKVSNELL
jgi:DGQHR domain-containing protein